MPPLDKSTEFGIFGFVNLTHPPFPNFFYDPEMRKRLADLEHEYLRLEGWWLRAATVNLGGSADYYMQMQGMEEGKTFGFGSG